MDTVLENATYVDNQLGIILYKKSPYFYIQNFQVYDLTKSWAYLPLYSHTKSYGSDLQVVLQLIISTSDKSYLRKKTTLLIKNVGEDTDDLLQPFFYAVSQEFPRGSIRIWK